jgi:hypothetical protein
MMHILLWARQSVRSIKQKGGELLRPRSEDEEHFIIWNVYWPIAICLIILVVYGLHKLGLL